MVKHGLERLEDKGQILASTDLDVHFSTADEKILVSIDFATDPDIKITKEAYEKLLKSIDNIALKSENEQCEAETPVKHKSSHGFKPIRAILDIHSLKIDLRDEANRSTVKISFYDFKCHFQKDIPTAFSCDLVLGAIEAIDSLEKSETFMLRSRKRRKAFRRSNSWPKIDLTRSWQKNKRLCAIKTDAPKTSKKYASKGNLFSKENRAIEESLVRISIKQQNPRERFANRQIKINFSELEAGINLQTWVMLLDFLTPSSAPLDRSTSVESTKSDGLTQQVHFNKRSSNLFENISLQSKCQFSIKRGG